MTSNFYKSLDTLYSLPPMERYETILKIAVHVERLLMKQKDHDTIELGKKVMEKIHGIRYLMASDKSTDSGGFDMRLKAAWSVLNDLINDN
jgi:hypothetical protein